MTPLRAKMITDMQLHRLAPGTQALYLREVASFATFYGRSPDPTLRLLGTCRDKT